MDAHQERNGVKVNIELERQVMHGIFGLAYLAMFMYLQREISLKIVFIVLAVGLLVAFIHHRHKLPYLDDLIEKFERTDESRIVGEAAIKFTFGVLLSALVFYLLDMDNKVILGAIATLTFGDSASTIIGRKFGKTKIFRNKSLEGTVAGIAVAAAAMSFFLPLHVAVAAATVGMLAELIPVNDNYSIPLTTGAAIALLL